MTKKRLILWIFALFLAVSQIACGNGGAGGGDGSDGSDGSSSDGSASSDDTVVEPTKGVGVFSGSTIIGVPYTNSDGTLSGVTGSNGEFDYLAEGDTVTFKVGNVTLGTVTIPASSTYDMTAYHLVTAGTNNSDIQATNIMRFLRAIDDLSDNPDTIQISTATVTALSAAGVETVTIANLLPDDFESQVVEDILPNYYDPDVEVPTIETASDDLKVTKALVEAALLGSLEVTSGGMNSQADGQSTLSIIATLTDTEEKSLIGEFVSFSATSGTLSASSARTNSSGKAIVIVTAPLQTAASQISATYGGSTQSITVNFVPGLGNADQSTLTVDPSSLVADGVSSTKVSVTLKDINDNWVADGTQVTLTTTSGTITSNNPATTSLGLVEFTLTAPSTSSTASLALVEFPGLTGSVVFGDSSDPDADPDPDSEKPVSGITTQEALGVGTFVGSKIVGVQYINQAGSIWGLTDSNGGFNYLAGGDQVTFYVGNVILGKATIPTSTAFSITSYHLVTAGNADADSQATNIMRFLQAIDALPDNANILEISEETRTLLSNSDITQVTLSDLDPDDFDDQVVTNLLPTYYDPDVDVPLLDPTSSTLKTTKALVEAARLTNMSVSVSGVSPEADGKSTIPITATLVDSSGSLVGGFVSFSTTAGTLNAPNARTDANGKAIVILTASKQTAVAVISATFGGSTQLTTVNFVPGGVEEDESSLTVNPATLAADGVSTTQVSVILKDANQNSVADGTQVTLSTTLGTVSSSNPTTTTLGRAEFTLTAPISAGTAQLSLAEFPGVSGDIEFGTSSTYGKAASIRFISSSDNIFVAGVGKVENSEITIEVRDDSGNLIDENNFNDTSVNNLRISLAASPNGGEFVSGRDAEGITASTTIDSSILVRSTNGSLTLNLKAGILPGVVEILVEALDSDGTLLTKATSSQITISSGPPHTIVLSNPLIESIKNLEGGVYCRRGTALVTDRFGNAVPDDTAITLGIMDAVIAEESNGVIVADDNALTSDGATFQATNSIVRNGADRGVESGDRVLIENAQAEDKSRFIDFVADDTTLRVQSNYTTAGTGQHYFIGASLMGSFIGGGDDCNALTTGTVTTTGGLAQFRVTYPANENTIKIGCYGYVDDVYSSENSSQVIVVASSGNSGATTIRKGQFCFAPVDPFTLKLLSPDPMTGAGQQSFRVKLQDGGDEISLPNENVVCTSTGGVTFDSATQTTGVDGTATFEVTTTGAIGEIACSSGDATLTIEVNPPVD